MFALEFMKIAFVASGVVSIIVGLIGYFLLIRREAFAGHALSHIGFAGATGASLIGLSPFLGLIIFNVMAGIWMGQIGAKLKDRDIAIGLILSASLGLGLLFLHFYTHYATQISSLLFGNVFGVTYSTLYWLIFLTCCCCLAMGFLMRPLLFVSLQPDLAQAQGISVRLVSTIFLMIVALVTAACVQITGILLVFSLMVGPAAVALRISKTIWAGIGLSILLALSESWGGLWLSWLTDWPVSFWISLLSIGIYGLTLVFGKHLRSLRIQDCYHT